MSHSKLDTSSSQQSHIRNQKSGSDLLHTPSLLIHAHMHTDFTTSTTRTSTEEEKRHARPASGRPAILSRPHNSRSTLKKIEKALVARQSMQRPTQRTSTHADWEPLASSILKLHNFSVRKAWEIQREGGRERKREVANWSLEKKERNRASQVMNTASNTTQ